MAQQIAEEVEEATAPHQNALKSKAGSECVAHILQTRTDADGQATVVSIGGIGAFVLVSRNAMLRGSLSLERGSQSLPLVHSTSFWEDETGEVRHIWQGEGGEQGDPFMPLLICLAQHAPARLEAGEYLFACLDDLYLVCRSDRVGDVHAILQEELLAHAHISVHHGKTKVWN